MSDIISTPVRFSLAGVFSGGIIHRKLHFASENNDIHVVVNGRKDVWIIVPELDELDDFCS
jgi:hypothetical protein